MKSRDLFIAGAIGLSAFFLLCGYEFVRSPAISLFEDPEDGYGVANLPLITALMPLGLAALLYLYGRTLSWCGPRRTLRLSSLCSGLGLTLCYYLVAHGYRPARGALFILSEAYVVILIEQYWSFLDSSLGTAQAKRLNGPICGLASLGAILGDYLISQYAAVLGSAAMLLFGALATLPAALCSDIAYARRGEAPPEQAKPHGGQLGLGEFGRHPMLIRLLLIIVSTQIIATALNFAWRDTLVAAIPNTDQRTAWSGGFYYWLNWAAAGGQFVLAPLLLRFISLRLIHYAIPLANVVACLFLVAHPSLMPAAAAYLVFKACDYSVFRAAKEILYIPFPFNVRYRAKEVIDVFGYRFGKGGYAALVAVLKQHRIVFLAGEYALTAMASAGVWVLFLGPLLRGYQRRAQEQSED